jgi:hypothetical protein
MSPAEFNHVHEMRRPRDPRRDYAGSLTQADVEQLYKLLD